MAKISRWCLDLNIWCAAILADLKQNQGSACQNLVSIVQTSKSHFGSVELIISWGMLNRLHAVLLRLQISPEYAFNYIDNIRAYTSLNPSLTLGGTGVIPLQDVEDRHVLETAIAGKADFLITANFQDFQSKETQIIIPSRHYLYQSPNHKIHIVHPYLMMEWIRKGS
jgi:predicted nucleic acid-binding protein